MAEPHIVCVSVLHRFWHHTRVWELLQTVDHPIPWYASHHRHKTHPTWESPNHIVGHCCLCPSHCLCCFRVCCWTTSEYAVHQVSILYCVYIWRNIIDMSVHPIIIHQNSIIRALFVRLYYGKYYFNVIMRMYFHIQSPNRARAIHLTPIQRIFGKSFRHRLRTLQPTKSATPVPPTLPPTSRCHTSKRWLASWTLPRILATAYFCLAASTS